MLDLEPQRWRKPRRENFEEHKKKVLEFADCWKPFDWTTRKRKNENVDSTLLDKTERSFSA